MPSETIDFRKLKVLLIDDEPFIRKIIRRILVDIGCSDILEADNGAEGIRQIKEHGKALDIVILDLNMPLIDGFQFLAFVRKDPQSTNKDIPVVVLSGHSEVQNMVKAAETGIHGFSVKPVSKAVLQKQMVRALTKPMLDADVVKWALRNG